ncbi:MAG: protoglobin domain-containing protein [Deltaproteobacteria bacterium]
MSIPGYALGSATLPASPVSLAEFELMKNSALFGDDDIAALRQSLEVLEDQTEAILDVWYGFVGANPHLLKSFTNPADGKPLGDYLGGVRRRFGQWILDTARAQYDATWLAYQHEIGHRHYRTRKNKTDNAPSTELVPFRDLFLLIYPVTATLKPFLAKHGHSAEDVDKMHAAWVKSCLLQMTLWAYPYVGEGAF